MIAKLCFNIFLTALLGFYLSGWAYAQDFSQSPSLIFHHSSQQELVSLEELRAIYTLQKRTWSDGQEITVFVLDTDDVVHQRFCKEVLGVFPRQLESIWYRRVFSGTGKSPQTVTNQDQMIELVTSTPGAIGYVLTEVNNEKLIQKILQ